MIYPLAGNTERPQYYSGDYCFNHVRQIPGRPPEKVQAEKTKLVIVEDEVKFIVPMYERISQSGKRRIAGWHRRTEKRRYLQCPSCFMRIQLKTK